MYQTIYHIVISNYTLIPTKISWLTKQGYSSDYIEEVIASDALNEQPKDDEAKEVIDKDVKAAQDAAKAGAQAAKNVMGGVFGIGGKLVGNAAQKAQKMTGQPAYKPGVGPGAPGAVKSGTMPPGQKPPEGAKPPDQEDKHVKFAEGIKQSEHKPAFVKHINKTRTMSAKQKWDWAFDKILQVGKKLPAAFYNILHECTIEFTFLTVWKYLERSDALRNFLKLFI